jgi:dsRNA-specific ribonuclease
VRVSVASGETAEATAKSKRLAEQAAARMLLERMEQDGS